MRRIARATWLAMAGALLASALSAAALMQVTHEPRLATQLSPALGQRLLSVVTPDGVLVVTADGVHRYKPNARVEPIAWSEPGQITSVRSAAWSRGRLALVASVRREGQTSTTDNELLIVEGNAMTAISFSAVRPIGVLSADDHFVVYTLSDRVEQVSVMPRNGGWATLEPIRGAEVPTEAVEGVLSIENRPYLLIGERGAHWLLGDDRELRPLPDGAYSLWSASLLRPPMNDASRMPFMDAHGQAQVFAPVGAPALVVEADGTLAALPVTRGADEPGVFVTNSGLRRIEVKHSRRRVIVSGGPYMMSTLGRPDRPWRAVATSVVPHDFTALPLGDHWLLLGADGSEAVEVDDHLARFDSTGGAGATVAALTSQPPVVWLALLGLLGGLALVAPLVARRAVRGLRLIDDTDGLFLGTLKLPPGAVGQTGRQGRVELAGNCQLRSGAAAYDLSSGPLRFDGRAAVPLVDGDRVYVVGRAKTDQAGGPWRSSHRQRLGADGGRYWIGRGGAEEFARRLAARANAQLFAFALVHLALALSALGFLGLRPFI